MNVNCVRKIDTKVQGIGPRASHAGPVRSPVINGSAFTLTEQSTPIEYTAKQFQYLQLQIIRYKLIVVNIICYIHKRNYPVRSMGGVPSNFGLRGD